MEISGLDNLVVGNISHLNQGVTRFLANKEEVSGNELVEVRMEYALKDGYKDAVSGLRAEFTLPEGINFAENSVKVGSDKSEYTTDTNYTKLTVPLTEASGSIVFYVKPAVAEDIYTMNASLTFTYNNASITETVGQLELKAASISMTAPSVTSNKTIAVSGVAIPQKQVRIYVNGVNVAKTVSAKNGAWSKSIQLPDTTSNMYSIYAVVMNGDKTIAKTEEQAIVYNEIQPEVTEFKMIYNNQTYDILKLYRNGQKPNISFVPGKQMTFVIGIKNDASISNVCVTSTRNGETKKLKAIKKGDTWIATGYFDENNTSYVPGYLNVTFNYNNINKIEKIEPKSIEEIQAIVDDMPAEVTENVDVQIVKNTDSELEGSLVYTDPDTQKDTTFSYSITQKKVSAAEVYTTNLISQGYKNIGDNKFLKTQTDANEKTTVNIIDTNNFSAVTYAFDATERFMKAWGTKYPKWVSGGNTILSIAGTGLDLFNVWTDNQQRKEIIQNSNLSPEQKQDALDKLSTVTDCRLATIGASLALGFAAETLTAAAIKLFALTGAAATGMVKASATTLFETAVLKGVKKKGAKVTITWKKTAGASGYEIYVSQKKASGYTKKETIKKGKTQKITLGKWKKGKQYYVKVRAYKTVKGKKVCGASFENNC